MLIKSKVAFYLVSQSYIFIVVVMITNKNEEHCRRKKKNL